MTFRITWNGPIIYVNDAGRAVRFANKVNGAVEVFLFGYWQEVG